MLEAQQISRQANDGTWLLKHVSIHIQPGDRWALSGPTGSGKTVLLRVLSLLDEADEGRLLWKGHEIPDQQVPEFRSQVVYLHQRPVLIEGTVEAINPGPVVTVFEFQPAPGVKVSQIVNLQDDLALALKAEAIRIDRIPGRSTLGIEVPNSERALIRLGHLLADVRAFGMQQGAESMRPITDALYWLLPNFDRLDIKGPAANGDPIELARVALSSAYAVLYSAVLLSAAVLLFRRRDFK